MASLEELQILREEFPDNEEFHFSIYPGHPVTVAYLITRIFPTYESAFKKSENSDYSSALASCKIPGAGGNVSNAMCLLRYLKDGMSWALAMKYADDAWARCDGQAKGGYEWGKKEKTPEDTQKRIKHYQDRWRKGQQQADKLKLKLFKLADWWQ